jgi:hypothetical protein
MADVDAALSANRQAADDLLAACERCSAVWTAPRAQGKWSPSQLVEHVARAYEESANSVAGAPTKFPKVPGLLRPVLRIVFFNRVVKKGTFFKGRTNKAMDPIEGPATPAAARGRLDEAVRKFEQACRRRIATADSYKSSIFGTVAVSDYIKFQELHTRHHRKQLPES